VRSRLSVLVVSAAVALLCAAPAAAEPCWQRLISDWSDGRIDRVYAPQCYRAAMAKLPDDAESVSTVETDLQRGLATSLSAAPAAGATDQSASTTPVLIVIAVGGAFLLVSSARMLRARRRAD
jgi:hypothetical protein